MTRMRMKVSLKTTVNRRKMVEEMVKELCLVLMGTNGMKVNG